MHYRSTHGFVATCLVVGVQAMAQTADLPLSLSGRWTWTERNFSENFSLDDIKAQPEGAFSAKLTWWTVDSKCAIRGVPIVGKQTDIGISFNATTKCDVTFAAELGRAQTGWTGKATSAGANAVVVQLKAN